MPTIMFPNITVLMLQWGLDKDGGEVELGGGVGVGRFQDVGQRVSICFDLIFSDYAGADPATACHPVNCKHSCFAD